MTTELARAAKALLRDIEAAADLDAALRAAVSGLARLRAPRG